MIEKSVTFGNEGTEEEADQSSKEKERNDLNMPWLHLNQEILRHIGTLWIGGQPKTHEELVDTRILIGVGERQDAILRSEVAALKERFILVVEGEIDIDILLEEVSFDISKTNKEALLFSDVWSNRCSRDIHDVPSLRDLLHPTVGAHDEGNQSNRKHKQPPFGWLPPMLSFSKAVREEAHKHTREKEKERSECGAPSPFRGIDENAPNAKEDDGE